MKKNGWFFWCRDSIWKTYGLHALAESSQAFLVCLHFFRWRHTHALIQCKFIRAPQGSFSCLLRETWGGRLRSISLTFVEVGSGLGFPCQKPASFPVTRSLSSSPLAPLEALLPPIFIFIKWSLISGCLPKACHGGLYPSFSLWWSLEAWRLPLRPPRYFFAFCLLLCMPFK